MKLLSSASLPVTAILKLPNSNFILVGDSNLSIYEKSKPDKVSQSTFTYKYENPILNGQQIHSLYSSTWDPIKQRYTVIASGGKKVVQTSFSISVSKDESDSSSAIFDFVTSNIINLEDWIFNIVILDKAVYAVTAHNELVLLNFEKSTYTIASLGPKAALFSAHAIPLDPQSKKILIAAGTVFGDLIVWSCTVSSSSDVPNICHYILKGHHGSIFDVRISNVVKYCSISRVVVSCSDDRTIRVWNISDLNVRSITEEDKNTGFQEHVQNNLSLATIMGHESRIWRLRIIPYQNKQCSNPFILRIISTGEDATCHSWDLIHEHEKDVVSNPNPNPNSISSSFILSHYKAISSHNGKNIWSIDVDTSGNPSYSVYTGGADGAIYTFDDTVDQGQSHQVQNFNIQSWDLYMSPQSVSLKLLPTKAATSDNLVPLMSPKIRPHIKEVVVVENKQVFAICNDGRVFKSQTRVDKSVFEEVTAFRIDQRNDYVPFHLLTPTDDGRYIFMATKSSIYCFDVTLQTLHHVLLVTQKMLVPENDMYKEEISLKINSIHAPTKVNDTEYQMFLTFVGIKCQAILYVNVPLSSSSSSSSTNLLSIIPRLIMAKNSFQPTSVAMSTSSSINHLAVGYRAGSIDLLQIDKQDNKLHLASEITTAHQKNEAVTGLQLMPTITTDETSATVLWLTSVARDGFCAIHCIDTTPISQTENQIKSSLIHKIALPTGFVPEGLGSGIYYDQNIIYGFRKNQFCIFDLAKYEELCSVPCEGRDRAWDLRITNWSKDSQNRAMEGVFAWVRSGRLYCAMKMNAQSQQLIHGMHGRDIKAVAITKDDKKQGGSVVRLVATGAEDTLIRISTMSNIHHGLMTEIILKEHNTGIQKIMWSDDGHYLFTAGSLEEFFVWRKENIPGVNSIFIRLIKRYDLKSTFGDARITGFDISCLISEVTYTRFLITLVASNSTIKVVYFDHRISSQGQDESNFHLLAESVYTNACLTEAYNIQSEQFLRILVTSSDGSLLIYSTNIILSPSYIPPSQLALASVPVSLQPDQPNAVQSTLGSTLHLVVSKTLHQSTINTCYCVPFPVPHSIILSRSPARSTYITCTGGDDNAIAVSILQFGVNDDAIIVNSIRIPNAHAAAVTGVRIYRSNGLDRRSGVKSPAARKGVFSGDKATDGSIEADSDSGFLNDIRVVSVGCDQRVKLWSVPILFESESSKLVFGTISRLADEHTNVADIGSIELYSADDSENKNNSGSSGNDSGGDGGNGRTVRAVIVGVGIEDWEIGIGEL